MPGVTIALPHITGGDVAGAIADVGPGVTGLGEGLRVVLDPIVWEGTRFRVLGEHVWGGMAEYVRWPAANVIPLPDDVTYQEAASLPIAYGTAWRMLVTRAVLRPGEKVLILGASGGLGTAAVQIAKLAGATVYAAAGSQDKLERLRQLGADVLINYREVDFSREIWRLTDKVGVDVVIDHVGKETWSKSLRSARVGGRIATCGATTGFDAAQDLRYVWVRELTIIGSNAWTRADLLTLLELVRTKRLTPIVDRLLPLERAAEAETLLEERKVFGKVILQV
jgi:alcohol dehydrogenase